MEPDAPRPPVLDTAVWLLVAAAAMLLTGGLLTAASVDFQTLREVAPPSVPDEAVRSSLWLYRGAGLLFALAGAGLLATTLGARRGDLRLGRATVALGMAIVVLVILGALAVGTHILVLLSVLPVIIGVVLLRRPAVAAWFSSPGLQTGGDVGRDDGDSGVPR